MDLSPISEICRKIDDIIEMIKATVKVKPVPMDSTSSIKHHIVEANRAAQHKMSLMRWRKSLLINPSFQYLLIEILLK